MNDNGKIRSYSTKRRKRPNLNFTLLWSGLKITRAVARFLVTGHIIASAEGTNLLGGCGGILPQKIFNLEAPKRYFQHLSWDMSPKNRPRIWKWQTIASHLIIKITESKESKSIHRLDVSISGPRGAAGPLASPLTTYGFDHGAFF